MHVVGFIPQRENGNHHKTSELTTITKVAGGFGIRTFDIFDDKGLLLATIANQRRNQLHSSVGGWNLVEEMTAG